MVRWVGIGTIFLSILGSAQLVSQVGCLPANGWYHNLYYFWADPTWISKINRFYFFIKLHYI